MANSSLPDVAFLCECFSYDPVTGKLTWLQRPASHFQSDHISRGWNQKFAGKTAASLTSQGYQQVSIGHKRFYNHRIIWKMVTGKEAPEIDHKNGNPADNRWDNLRECSRNENLANTKIGKKNNTGFKGACLSKATRRYRAKISINGKQVHLGYFDTAEEAHCAYCTAAKKAWGEFWNDGHSGKAALSAARAC